MKGMLGRASQRGSLSSLHLRLPHAASIAVVAAVLLSACGPTANSSGASLCSALAGLRDNQSDFQIVLTDTSATDAYAALDRVAKRAQTAVDQLRAIDDPKVRPSASELADIEARLIPILDQIRSVSDQASWSAATKAYSDWYYASSPKIASIGQALVQSGVTCGS